VGAGLVLRGAVAPPGRDDDPVARELVGHEDGLVEQAAGVVAEVEHEALRRVPPAARVSSSRARDTSSLVRS
jgi:hypothetical protein